MKILCIKDNACSGINDFRERITNASFRVSLFELKKKKE